jgi:hypothetical protein
MPTAKPIDGKISAAFEDFKKEFAPLQTELPILTDKCTDAKYCECHVKAKKIVALGTTGAPLDTEHPEYKANREIALNDAAFLRMKADATKGRGFSNIVAEYPRTWTRLIRSRLSAANIDLRRSNRRYRSKTSITA